MIACGHFSQTIDLIAAFHSRETYPSVFPCSCALHERSRSKSTEGVQARAESLGTHKVSRKSFRASAGVLHVDATTVHAPAPMSAATSTGRPHKSSTLTQEHDSTTTTQRDRSMHEKSRDAKIPSASCIPASAATVSEPERMLVPPTHLPEKCRILGRCFKNLPVRNG
jgi:hypothetical protein